jgi:tRNA threonylcarbamoyl adenosine modification protein YeaZ
MLVLALDASLGPVSAAVVDTADGRAFVRRDGAPEGRAERLPRLVASLLAESAVSPTALDRIAVTTGPGGFTGVRVGVAFVRGFALVHGTAVVGIDTLVALALSAGEAPAVLAYVHGRKGRVLTRRFGAGGEPLGPTDEVDAAALPTLFPDAVLAGPDADRIGGGRSAVTEVDVVALARHAAGLDPACHPAEPRYAAPPDARAPAPSGLLAARAAPARVEMPARVRPAQATGEQ